jgi:hypothetical protein
MATSDAAANRASAAVLAEIDREARILSGYDPSSDSADGSGRAIGRNPCRPNCLTCWSVLICGRTRTKRRLDASAETVSRVWKAAAAENVSPHNRDRRGVAAVQRAALAP